MTAIGLALLAFGFAVAKYDDLDQVSRKTMALAAAAFWLGAFLVVAGVITVVWRVMP